MSDKLNFFRCVPFSIGDHRCLLAALFLANFATNDCGSEGEVVTPFLAAPAGGERCIAFHQGGVGAAIEFHECIEDLADKGCVGAYHRCAFPCRDKFLCKESKICRGHVSEIGDAFAQQIIAEMAGVVAKGTCYIFPFHLKIDQCRIHWNREVSRIFKNLAPFAVDNNISHATSESTDIN